MTEMINYLYKNLFNEDIHIPDKEKYDAANNVIADILETYKEKLPPDEYRQLDTLMTATYDMKRIEGSASFSFGFIIAAMLMVEVFTGKKDILKDLP